MNGNWKEGLRRGMSGFLAFTMAGLLVLGDAGTALAGLSADRLFQDAASLWNDDDISGSVVDEVSFENQELDGVLISVSSENSDFRPGEDVTLNIYVKNETDQTITGGTLSYEGNGIQKSTGDLTLLGKVDVRDLFALADEDDSEMESTDLVWDLDENGDVEDLASESDWEWEEDIEAERDGITLEPGEIYAAQFEYVVDKSVDERTTEGFQIDFRFEGTGEEDDTIEAEETFSFTANYLNVETPVFEDGNLVKTGETVTMGIHANLHQVDSVLTDSWEDASPSDAEEAEEDVTVATPSQASAATSSATTTATSSNASAAANATSKVATASNALATASDAEEEDPSAEEELIDDRETTLAEVDLNEVRYEIEMYNAKLNGFKVKKAMVDDAEDNMLICTYRVSNEVEPGVYFGKITQISEANGSTYESTQGFALIVEGEGEITLEGSLGDMLVTVTGSVNAFPEADELEITVSEVSAEMEEIVDTAIQKRAEEDGFSVNAYRALDIKLYADGEEIEPSGSLQVTFKNVEMEEKSLLVKAVEVITETVGNAVKSVLNLFGIGETADVENGATAEEETTEVNKVFHLDESAGVANEIESSESEDGDIVIETNHFSIYVVANLNVATITLVISHYATLPVMSTTTVTDSNSDTWITATETVSGNRMYPGATSGSTYATEKYEIYSSDTITYPGYNGNIGVAYTQLLSELSKVSNGGNYTVSSVKVTNSNYSNGKTFTENGTDQNINLAAGTNTIEITYEPTTGTINEPVGFHDYNVTIHGPEDDSSHTGLYSKNVGMNNVSLGNGSTAQNRVGIGIKGTGTANINYTYGSSVNANTTGKRTGFVKKSLSDNMIQFYDKDPGLFTAADIRTSETYYDGTTVSYYAKKYISDYELEFTRSGDTYTLTSVYNGNGTKVLKDLDELEKTYDNGSRQLYSNLFWPLDGVFDSGTSDRYGTNRKTRDPLFGSNYGFGANDEDSVTGTTSTHNWYFGMRYDMEFTLGDYTGPMNYYFRGDDDLWVFVDGTLVIDTTSRYSLDIGGIGSSTGRYVDLRSWMKSNLGLNDANATSSEGKNDAHTLSIFYMERGGTGSCCYMQFTLPSATTVPTPDIETTSKTVTKTWLDGGNTSKRSAVTVQLYQNNVAYGNTVTLNESTNWQYTWDALPKYANNENKTGEYTYTVKEVTDLPYYSESWSGMTITNTLLTDISIEKVWQDSDGTTSDGALEDSVYVALFKKSGSSWVRADSDLITLSSTNSWSHTWQNLTAYDSSNNAIEYQVFETDSEGNRYADGTAITYDGREEKYIVTYDTSNSTVTNTYNYQNLYVEKTWVDYNNAYGTRPTELKIQLYQNSIAYGSVISLDADNEWKYTWTNIPIKLDSTTPYVYSIKELDKDENVVADVSGGQVATLLSNYDYTAEYDEGTTGTESDPFKVTNTLVTAKLRVVKEVENPDGLDGEPIDSAYKFLIQVTEGDDTDPYTSLAYGDGEDATQYILVVPPHDGTDYTIEEIVPAEYSVTSITGKKYDPDVSLENLDDLETTSEFSNTDNTASVKVFPDDDIVLIVTNTPEHDTYFHHTASVTNSNTTNATDGFEKVIEYDEDEDSESSGGTQTINLAMAALVDYKVVGWQREGQQEGGKHDDEI